MVTDPRKVDVIRSSPSELIARIRARDPNAEDELVRNYTPGVFYIVHRMVLDRSTAEDLYQESFRLILEKIRAGEIREPAKLSGFICSVVRNLVLGHFRKASRRQCWHELDDEAQLASPAADPLDQLLREEKAILARRVLASMESERDREALYRFYIAEDNKEDMCADLGLTASQFNVILFRARQRYKKLFHELVGNEK
jgi:RNA polymerase sigma-70 factor (ECF subfamily)